MKTQMQRWRGKLESDRERPAYLKIADIIATEIDDGSLQVRDRLPPLRDLADALDMNYTTAARGYNEARRRGLIDSRPGMGTFVKGKTSTLPLSGSSSFEMTMNLPAEPDLSGLLEQVRHGALHLFGGCDLYGLFRYQDFGGSDLDKEAAQYWLARTIKNTSVDRLLVCPGVHSALVGLLSLLVRGNGVVCTPSLVYPGLKAIAAQLNIPLQPLPSGKDGPAVKAFEDLCKTGTVRALYVNPTLQNPTTWTIPQRRREALADVALRYSIPIIEDEAYAGLPKKNPVAFADLAPEITYYITGLSKCFGAGLRVAYLHAPNKRTCQRLAGAMRALTVMASPITNALATEWILNGSADNMLKAIRTEAQARQQIASRVLRNFTYDADPDGFHLWLMLPEGNAWNPANVAAHLRSHGVGAVSSAAFSADNNPPNAIRLCLGGSAKRYQCEEALLQVADILEHPAHLSSVVL